jgi:hypothetical protein
MSGVREQEATHCEWHGIKLDHKVVRVSAKCDCRYSDCGPEGHMLHIIQRVGLRARVNCGPRVLENAYTCVTKPVCRNVGCHKFRRIFATWNDVLGGVSIAVQKWLGHSDIETTMRYIPTSEIRKGMTEHQLNQTWAGMDANPSRLSVVAYYNSERVQKSLRGFHRPRTIFNSRHNSCGDLPKV